MGELVDFMTAASGKLGVPAEMLSGLPVIELTGDRAVMLGQHGGIVSYSDVEVRIAVNIGFVTVCGSELIIRVMNRQKIILCGKITEVRIERQRHDKC